LERLALYYAGRYGTTRTKLAGYLNRKLKERGWDGDGTPPVDAIVARFSELGFVNDKAFAEARSAALQRRGYGERRVAEALRASGVDEEDGAAARAQAAEGAWAAALRFAERRRVGPFAPAPLDRPARERAFAAMMRAGHSTAIARRLINAAPGEIPNPDTM
jgi:regulatory protein